jgi:hypothetical protein
MSQLDCLDGGGGMMIVDVLAIGVDMSITVDHWIG